MTFAHARSASRWLSMLLVLIVGLLVACERNADGAGNAREPVREAPAETDRDPAPVDVSPALPVRASSVPARGVDDAVSGVLELVPALTGTRMISAGPVQSGGLVVTGDVTGELRARATDGSAAGWRRRGTRAATAMAVDGTSVYVAAGATVSRIDPADGDELWSVTLAAPVVSGVLPGPRRVYVATGDGSVVALTIEDGSQAWRLAVSAPVTGRLVLADGVLYATAPRSLVAIGAMDGSLIWRHDAPAGDAGDGGDAGADARFAAAPAAADGRIVLVAVNGTVVTLDTEGREIDSWSFGGGPVLASPLVAEDTIIVVDGAGTLEATDLEGKPRWSASIGTQPAAEPVHVGRTIVVAGADGRVVAYDTDTGEERSRIVLASAPRGEAAYLDGRLVWALENGSVQPISVDGASSDAPLLAGDEPHRLPPDGNFRLRDDRVELLMRSQEDAVFEITAVATPPEDLILRVQDDGGDDVATNMGKVTLEPIVRSALEGGRPYLLVIERPAPRSEEVTISLTTEQVR